MNSSSRPAKVHVLGIGGTFMAGLALLARESGFEVSGYDKPLYPPMSTQLNDQGIAYSDDRTPYPLDCDEYVIGNALSRGNPFVEQVLNEGLSYTSGPAWLAREVLAGRHVVAVSGTHGKSTTSSLVAWLLEACGEQPGFLIGAIPSNFGVSARLGQGRYFVIEADEYDTAFFDKQSKFLHYRPNTLIMNNLEYDHADIFPDISAIKRQFQLLLRTVPAQGHVISHASSEHLEAVIQQGCWTPVTRFGLQNGDWHARLIRADGSEFEVWRNGQCEGVAQWELLGNHNVSNALAALAVVHALGLDLSQALAALSDFRGVKRRLERVAEGAGVVVYDDFAHHPTAIAETIAGVKARIGAQGRVCVLLECRSNTMKMGVHKDRLSAALEGADQVWLYQPVAFDWSVEEALSGLSAPVSVFSQVEEIGKAFESAQRSGDHWVIMSNGDSSKIREQLRAALESV